MIKQRTVPWLLLTIPFLSSAEADLRAQSGNLLPNPGFESIGNCAGSAWSDSTCPESYTGTRTGQTLLVTTQSDGNRVLRIELIPEVLGDAVTGGASYRLEDVRPGEVYEFSALVRTESFQGRTELSAYGRDETSTSPAEEMGRVEVAGPSTAVSGQQVSITWQRIALRSVVPEGATVMLFNALAVSDGCTSVACGNSAFDDLVVRRLENNLAENPYFEHTGTCTTSSWSDLTCPDGYSGSVTGSPWLGTVSREGDRSLHVDFTSASGPSTQRGTAWLRLEGVVPGDVYEFSSRIRTEDFKGRTRLVAYGRDYSVGGASGQLGRKSLLGPSTLVADEAVDTGWERHALQITVPESATTMFFNLSADLWWHCPMAPCGTADFDDVIVRRLETQALANPGLEVIGDCEGSQWPDTTCPDGFEGLHSSAVPISTVDLGGDRAFLADFDQVSGPSTQTGGLGLRIEDVEPGGAYVFSAMVRPQAFKGRTRLFAYGRDQSPGGVVGQLGRVDVYGPSTQVADQAVDDDWRRITLEIDVPDHATIMYFYASGDLWWHCTAAPCGEVLFDDLTLEPRPDLPAAANPCDDDSYLDLMGNTCRAVDKPELGFDADEFAQHLGPEIIRLADCDEGDLLSALTDLESQGGGILYLPACQFALTDAIEIPDNVIVQGAGVGRTWITAESTNLDNDLLIFGEYRNTEPFSANHLILRDLSLSSNKNEIGIHTADNVLIERVEVYGGLDKSGVSIWRSHRVSVRHSTIRDNTTNGLTNGRCLADPDMDGPDEGDDVSFTECTGGYPPGAMENYRLTSNEIYGNTMGIDAHASLGEIAGNSTRNNTHGAKMIVGADRLWVHHNDFSAVEKNGLKIHAEYSFMDASAAPSQHVYYANRVHDNGAWGVQVSRAIEIYFLGNTFQNNGCVTLGSCPVNTLRINDKTPPNASVFSCPGDEVAATGVAGRDDWHAWLDAQDPLCDLAAVGQIFD